MAKRIKISSSIIQLNFGVVEPISTSTLQMIHTVKSVSNDSQR